MSHEYHRAAIHGCQCHRRRGRVNGGEFAAGGTPHYPPDLTVEPRHLDIDLFIDLANETASGTVTTTATVVADGPAQIELDAVDFDDVTVVTDGTEAPFSYDGHKLRIQLGNRTSGEDVDIAVSYRVVRPRTGLTFSRPSDEWPDDPWFAATDHETERARFWLPCIDQPSVRTTLDFHLRAEDRFTVLANGAQTGRDAHDDGTHTVHWRLEQTCPSYLTCFAIGELTKAEDGEFDGKPIAYFAASHVTEEDLLRTFGRTGQMLAWMTDKLGHPFPYPKYFQFALPGIGGAMENISLVSWDDKFVLDETLAREWTWLADQVNVHEMAHSYFGDLIVCRDFAHAWLKESWATYMETCWLEHKHGEDEMRYDLWRNAQAYFRESDNHYTRPIVTRRFRSSWEMYDNHLYPGGAVRLHTLRSMLGDETFWAGVRDYVSTFAGKVVETNDFRRTMETHSGRSLGQFFDQWLHTAGYPHVEVTFTYDADEKQGRFVLEQKQVGKDGQGPLFDLHTDVGWFAEGAIHTQTIKFDKARQVVVVAMDNEPDHVRFDPHARVVHKLTMNPGDAKLKHQLLHADVIGRIEAARTLAKSAKHANLTAIAEAFAEEEFWGVRAQMATFVGKVNTAHAAALVADMIRAEDHPLAMAPVFRAGTDFRDERIRRAIAARVAAGDLPYHAHAAALVALGSQRQDPPIEELIAASRQQSLHGFVQGAALNALAQTHNRDVIVRLFEALRPGDTDKHARRAGIGALARACAQLDKHERGPAIDTLEDLLRDADPIARNRAARGLVTLQATRSIGALESFGATLPPQEKIDVDDLVDALRKGVGPEVARLQKQVDELRDEHRKLERRLEDLEGDSAKDAT